jgi:hypothetical protein
MYHRAGKKESFAQLLTVALGDDSTRGSVGNQHLFVNDEDRISCLNALSFYYHQVSASETANDMYEKWMMERTKNLNLADYIHASSTESVTTKTYYYIS